MSEKRKFTMEDILLKQRLAGAGVEVRGELAWQPPTTTMEWAGPRVVLDDTDMVLPSVGLSPNPKSPLQVLFDGEEVTITERGETVATGRVQPTPPWCGEVLSDGVTRVADRWMTNIPTECYLNISNRCFAYDSGQTCSYCGFGHAFAQSGRLASLNDTIAANDRTIEATVVAIRHGWRGAILLVGGLLQPKRRGKWFTDVVEGVMTRLRECLDDDDLLSELHIAVDNAPPDDLAEYEKWKSFGVNAIAIDTEVLDPAYFAAICPAKDKPRWDEAQEAAVEVFGRGRGSSNLFVCGIEPMAGMLEGVEERVSKGVFVIPLPFFAHPDSPMAKMSAPSPEWFLEAQEKIIDIYLEYADTFEVDLTLDDRWGYTRRTRSMLQIDDLWIRRLQEMGRLPAGLPNQYTVEAV